MVVARNLVIVALLALGLTVLPGGGNLAEAIVTALSLALLALIGLSVGRLWDQSALTRDSFSEQQAITFYSALGVLALLVVGTDELLDTGIGTLVWIAALGGAIAALIATWRAASTY